MTNRRAARSPKQRQAMRTTTGVAVPVQQQRRDPDQTFDPRTLPDLAPKPYFDYERREWVFPELDESIWGKAAVRTNDRSWSEERR